MTEANLKKTIRIWQKRLGLDGWRIDIVFCDDDEETWIMQTHRSLDYDSATIHVRRSFIKTGSVCEEVEAICVHELLHCALQKMYEPMTLLSRSENVSRAVFKIIDCNHENREEEVVDHLAYALVAAWKTQ